MDDQQTRTETYRGRELQADAWRDGKFWSWTYLIDGVQHGQSTRHAQLPTGEAALTRALNAARARVDGGMV